MDHVIEVDTTPSREFYVLNADKKKFADNSIHTTKYNIFTFIFIFMYIQFRKLANAFFLLVALLQQIPGVSPVGRYITIIPLTVILSISAVNEIIEDTNRRKSDLVINNQRCKVFRLGWFTTTWSNIIVGDIIQISAGETFPSDIIVISTSEPSQLCYVQTSSLDGENNYKIKQAPEGLNEYKNENDWGSSKCLVRCDLPNNNLYKFNGLITLNSKTIRIDNENIVLRGSQLQNTQSVIGIVVYTGVETKIMLNSAKSSFKCSYIEKRTNYYILYLLFALLVISITFTFCYEHALRNIIPYHWYLSIKSVNEQTFHRSFFTSFILFHNIIPISLVVTIEMVKVLQSKLIARESEKHSKSSSSIMVVKNSNVIEDFGIVNYIFTDKTGTLTSNKMVLTCFSVGTEKYLLNQENIDFVIIDQILNSPSFKLFVLNLLLCNTILVEVNKSSGEIFFQSSSPDEIAIIRSLSNHGLVFVQRSGSSVKICINGNDETWTILQMLEFNSERMRMSVIAKSPDGEIYLFCKGADCVILERLYYTDDEVYTSTISYLEKFSKKGLRTLCTAYRRLDEEEYTKLVSTFEQSTQDVLDKDTLLSKISDNFENNLILLGCTGIEDKLQENVPETIKSLTEARISILMCTGDKLETAMNIGFSCKLLNDTMDIQVLSPGSIEECSTFLKKIILENGLEAHYVGSKRKNPELKANLALILTGNDLQYAQTPDCIDLFITVLLYCRSVICCRLSPSQKQQLVNMFKNNVDDIITLAIGDGANDCSMIRAAHVGVGINGKEGTQAANCSDVAIGEFKDLTILLFVNGSDTFRRISNCIYFCFYKNIVLNLMHMFYNVVCLYSSMNIFSKFHLAVFNTIYTSLPSFCFGLLEEYCSQEAKCNLPTLFASLRKSEFFGNRRFFSWICNSVLHSILIFYLCYFACKYGVINDDGTPMDLPMFGTIVLSHALVVITIKAALEIRCWTLFVHIGIWGGLVTYVCFNILLCRDIRFFIKLAPYFLDTDLLLLKSKIFWSMFAIPIIVLLPDFLFHAVRNTWFKPSFILISEFENSQRTDWNEPSFIDRLKTDLSRSGELKTRRSLKYFGFAFSFADNVKSMNLTKVFKPSKLLKILPDLKEKKK